MAADLITVDEYKLYKGINGTTQDTQIESVIPAVSALVKSICRNSFNDYLIENIHEVFNGGGQYLILKEYPVTCINSVSFSSDYGQTYTELVEYTDYVFDEELQAVSPLSGIFTRYVNGYKVCYNAGYETLPEDLRIAVMDLVTYYLKNESTVGSAVATDSGSVSITYVNNNALPMHIKRVFDLYTSRY